MIDPIIIVINYLTFFLIVFATQFTAPLVQGFLKYVIHWDRFTFLKAPRHKIGVGVLTPLAIGDIEIVLAQD